MHACLLCGWSYGLSTDTLLSSRCVVSTCARQRTSWQRKCYNNVEEVSICSYSTILTVSTHVIVPLLNNLFNKIELDCYLKQHAPDIVLTRKLLADKERICNQHTHIASIHRVGLFRSFL